MNNENKKKWRERWFQVLLLLLGFLMGVLGTQIANYTQIRMEKQEVAKLLKVIVTQESIKNIKFIESLEKMVNEKSPKFMAPEGLEWQHNPTLLYNLSGKIDILEYDILSEFIGYLRMYEQCGAYKNLVINRLSKVGDSHQVDFSTLEAYLHSLKGVEKSAVELHQSINKHYSF